MNTGNFKFELLRNVRLLALLLLALLGTSPLLRGGDNITQLSTVSLKTHDILLCRLSGPTEDPFLLTARSCLRSPNPLCWASTCSFGNNRYLTRRLSRGSQSRYLRFRWATAAGHLLLSAKCWLSAVLLTNTREQPEHFRESVLARLAAG